MADSALPVKLEGANPTSGIETFYAQVDSSGNQQNIINNASGGSAVNIQDGGNSLTTDSTQLPSSLGQKTMANSLAVVLASDQMAIPIDSTGRTVTGTISAGVRSIQINCNGMNVLTVQTSSSVANGVSFYQSVDGINFDSITGIDVQNLPSQFYVNSNNGIDGIWKFDVSAIKIFKVADGDGSPSSNGTVVTLFASPGAGVISGCVGPLFIGNSSLSALATSAASIDTKTPVVGQAVMASSTPVVIASNQSPIPITGSITATNPSVSTTGTAVPASATMIGGSDGTNLKAVKVSSTGVISVDGSATTQPISAASLPLPSGASTSALQTTGNASLSSIDTKTPALGQALAAASVPVVLTAAQLTTLTPVSTVTSNAGTNLNTSALALETGGNLASIKTNTDNLNLAQSSTTSGQKGILNLGAVTTAAPTYVTAQSNPLSLTTVGALRVDNSAVTQPVSGTVSANATLSAETTKVIGTINIAAAQTLATVSAVTAITNALPTGSNTIGALTANQSVNNAQIAGVATATGNGVVGTGVQRVAIASDNTAFAVNSTLSAETTKVIGTVNQAALTKGTQGANGISTQDLKDAGRTAINLYAMNVASGLTTVETAITLTKSAGTAATSSAVSFVITNGKIFRIQNITVSTRGNAVATAQSTIFNLRLNTAGAVTTSSTPILMALHSATPATASAYDRVSLPIPDGFEITGNGTIQIGITANSTFVTTAPTWDVNIIGYEY